MSNVSLSTDKAGKTIGRWLAVVVAVLAVVTAVFYYVYESSINAVDSMVIVLLVVVAVCNVAYFLVDMDLPVDVMGLVEVASTVAAGYALTTYLSSDINNLADLLNGIVIFTGGVGDVNSIFALIALIAVIGVVQIVICFLPTNKKA